MILEQSNNIIVFHRGDSFSFPVRLVGGHFPFVYDMELTGNDIVYFGIMEPHQLFENAIIQKVYTSDDLDTNGKLWVRLDPCDTVDLIPGVYYYSIKIVTNTKGGEKVFTLIQKTKCIILD